MTVVQFGLGANIYLQVRLLSNLIIGLFYNVFLFCFLYTNGNKSFADSLSLGTLSLDHNLVK